MTEYWVNVYGVGRPWWISSRPICDQTKHKTREDAVKRSEMIAYYFAPTMYRIHVKLKPVPKYENILSNYK